MQKKYTHKSLSLTISFDKCAVIVWGGGEVEPDFNKILLGTHSRLTHLAFL